MSHKHWCDYAGHEWECSGSAIRPFQNEPTPCFCMQHQTSMDDGDHSNCPIELIACPEHRRDQKIAMGYDPDQPFPEFPQSDDESSMFKDIDGNPIVGFCLWCNCNFYSHEEHEAHTADIMAACPVFQQLKDQDCMPPALQAMFEDAGLIDPERQNDGE